MALVEHMVCHSNAHKTKRIHLLTYVFISGELCCHGYCIPPTYLVSDCCCPAVTPCRKGSTPCELDSDCSLGQMCCEAKGCSFICADSEPCNQGLCMHIVFL